MGRTGSASRIVGGEDWWSSRKEWLKDKKGRSAIERAVQVR